MDSWRLAKVGEIWGQYFHGAYPIGGAEESGPPRRELSESFSRAVLQPAAATVWWYSGGQAQYSGLLVG